MQRLEVSCAVRHIYIYMSLGAKGSRKKQYLFQSRKYAHLPGFEVGTFGVKPFAESNIREVVVNIFEQIIF